jgi:DNA repair protein RecO (recombination protein O)
MLFKTKAISLSYIRYKDTSIICRFFTEQFGLQSFVVNGVRSSKSKMPAGLFQPFSVLEIVQYHDEKKDLHRLSEVKVAQPLVSIPFSTAKSACVMFCAEVLGKVVKEGQTNSSLFQMVWDQILVLDKASSGVENWHIDFLLFILSPLGIEPENKEELISFWLKIKPIPIQNILGYLNNPAKIRLPNEEKQWLIDALLAYFQKHLEGMGQIQSLQILRQVFD